jgi:endonuclease/exonuclease/phosphatase family metal-dependent hydrolase
MNIQQKKNVLQHPALDWIRRTSKKAFRPAAYLLLIVTVLVSVVPAPAGSKDIGGKRTLDTMTINLYIGTGTESVTSLDQGDPNYLYNLVEAVTGIYYELLASKPPVRIGAVADQIAARKPDIVAVEEATLLQVHPGDDKESYVVYDYLQILVAALNARGAHYAITSTSNEWDIAMPMLRLDEYGSPVFDGGGNLVIDFVQQTDREAILVRTDLPRRELTVSNPQNGNFINTLDMIPGISLTRGWCSVDVSTRGQNFRYIAVHLEEETAPKIQKLQVKELLRGPADTNMPVIVVGDFNSDPIGRDGAKAKAYKTMTEAGFTDTWGELHPRNPAGGLTWGHDEYLADPSVHFNRRIDFVFFRGANFDPISAEPIDIKIRHTMGQPPFWASDHAAVFASLEIDTAPCPKDRKK